MVTLPRAFTYHLRKYVLATGIVLATTLLPVRSQIKYVPVDERRDAGMGIERVAMLFTETYESKLAESDTEIRWIQLDLSERKKIEGIKLLPKLNLVVSYVNSIGFPARFKIEVSDDSAFINSIMYEDQTRKDFQDPYDEICTFSGKEVYGRYVRLTATQLRQKRLALTKLIVLSEGKDIAEGCAVSDSDSGSLGLTVLTRPPRPQGEDVFTDNPGNIIPFEKWIPVSYIVHAPNRGVEPGEGLFKKAMENNIDYLMSSFTFDELVRNFYLKAGKPVKPLEERLNNFWMVDIPGSEVGRFLMGAGNTLRWIENEELRKRMNQLVDVIDDCKDEDGYIMAYPRNKIFLGEYGAYTRSWVTHGLLEAGYAGNEKAFPLLRGYYDWFNNSCYLPELLRRGGQGTQGLIPSTRMYFSPVGKAKDIEIVQQYFQENYWLEQLANKDPKAIWLYPYDRPHCYLITGIEPYLDMYRATGAKKYLDAAVGGWELYHNNWEHVGGTIAICEGHELYPPKSYLLHRGTGELCGSVFWIFLNQRFHLLYPDEEKYVSEIEKSIYNVAIANQIGTYGFRYTAALEGRTDLSSPKSFGSNTCCEGQGTRLIGALPEFIYSIGNDVLYVNLFASSTIKFPAQNDTMTVKMETQFPYSPDVKFTLSTKAPLRTSIKIRIPSWASNEMQVMINGKSIATGKPGSYLSLDRLWKNGDIISFILPMSFRLTRYTGSDTIPGQERYALEYGPVLFAYVNMNGDAECNKLPVSHEKLIKSLKPVMGKPLHFTINGKFGFEYMPYMEVHDEPFTCFP